MSLRDACVYAVTDSQGKNDIVIWDKIVRCEQDALMRIQNMPNKYGMRDYLKSFEYVLATINTQQCHSRRLPRGMECDAVCRFHAARRHRALKAVHAGA